ncbi:DNA polymerase epsilon subunit Dpb3 [Schizosaccharomyces osmophilus]|uniref:DNA polymerase epsilon subunit Dpb3 n=1 Tax=Schizosaccharomyces osmophilus TaxID=2545709 RepID=A0AAF0AV53_9SCHI|nr:DNA polymerase epsilon subunit Dpb3 [Schizosaccharomyces osmophilus]WBW73216.1 DNA polymerase epsilon subunit Dpb3 [Schizosaccharomyces osmophilus]
MTEVEPAREEETKPSVSSNAAEESPTNATSTAAAAAAASWKSRFPVARIKKIMQADQDVGKVAQVTPVIMSKALEMFMQSIINESCQQARLHQAKRVTVSHLKHAVKSVEQFDFLQDIVEKIPDAPPIKAERKPKRPRTRRPPQNSENTENTRQASKKSKTKESKKAAESVKEEEEEQEQEQEQEQEPEPEPEPEETAVESEGGSEIIKKEESAEADAMSEKTASENSNSSGEA